MTKEDITSKFKQDFSKAEFYIAKTNRTPMVAFKEGEMYIQGYSVSDNSPAFYAPVISKMEELVNNHRIHTINVDLEWANNAGAYQFMNLFKSFEKAYDNNLNRPLSINWCYEKGDEDTQQIAETLMSLVKIQFNIYEKKA